jgi:phosphatidylserine/phosphatidylglycerophosphate/cardiolipin synthase-like enzyme
VLNDEPVPGPGKSRIVSLKLLVDADHYVHLVQEAIPCARVSLWISTANLKELMVEAPIGSTARARGRYVPILDTVQSLIQRGVDVRILHATEPSRPFRAELQRRGALRKSLKMKLCPRVHMKVIAIDGAKLYLGSANFTGAGLGAKGEHRRNFELGVATDDDLLLDVVQARFDAIWNGSECAACRRRSLCPRPLNAR